MIREALERSVALFWPLRSSQRSGAWQKMRINQGQEFVIAGYVPSPKNFVALIFGYYEGDKLMYAARTRNGFTPAMREQLFKRSRGLEITACPFCQSSRKEERPLGPGIDRRQDGRVSVVKADARRAV